MLVLSRKAGEKIVINKDIEITVTHIKNGRVRIGIAAPQDVNIRRAELPDWSDATVGGEASRPFAVPTPNIDTC
jgi:carbon storage regulator